MKKPLFFIISIIITFVISSYSLIRDGNTIRTKVDLGKKLFSEKILSKDSSISCASCHKPEYGFADTSAFSLGVGGKLTKRNTPTVLNVKDKPYYFWDGRAATLEKQAIIPLQNPDEMALAINEAVERLNASPEYMRLFEKVFKQKPDADNLVDAIASFERSLETVNSKFDDWSNGLGKLTAKEEHGRQVFLSKKARCFDCHFSEEFTDDRFKNNGLYNGNEYNDLGRYVITEKDSDMGKFKTPGLRNIAATAPYMHNGMFKTLEEVVEYYNDPSRFVKNAINIDPALKKPLGLTTAEKADLVAFLKTLTDRAYIKK